LFTHPFAKNSLYRFCQAGAVFFANKIELTLSPKDEMQQFAVIFDMDGVIVNNGNYHKQAWKKFSKKHNIPFSEEKFKKTV
jgi:outer membrane protein assembly factor BamE (lipoprotein component of BamABCDE complex)